MISCQREVVSLVEVVRGWGGGAKTASTTWSPVKFDRGGVVTSDFNQSNL